MYKCEHYTDSLFYKLEQTAKYCRQLGMQVFERLRLGISPDEFYALDVLIVHGEICQRELARLILKDRPSTGRILDSLEQKGYIERYADTKNNRLVRIVKLTDDGRRITEEISLKLREYIATLPKVFSDEDKDLLKNLVVRFRQNLEQSVEMKI